MPARHRRHAGARRAALPVAQGDHGRALEGDRRRGRWPTSASTRPTVGGAAATTRGRSSRGSRRPAARPRSSASAPTRRRAGSSTSSPRGGSSDGGAHLGRRPRRRRRRAGASSRRGRDARPRRSRPTAGGADVAGIVVGGGAGARPRRSSPATCRACRRGRPSRRRRPRRGADRRRSALAALSRRRSADVVLVGAGPDGRDLAGALVGADRLAASSSTRPAVAWADGGPARRDERLRRQAHHRRRRSPAARGHRHGPAEHRDRRAAGVGRATVEAGDRRPATLDAARRHGRRPVERGGAALPIEEARIIVSGGRGVGGAGRLRARSTSSPSALGGAVGATRAAVDSGWIPYGQQIGQTGKIVKPQLYLALGISGAIQHKVGMQTAGHDRRGQSRSRRADRRVRRPDRRRRPVRGRAGAARRASRSGGLTREAGDAD